MNQQGKIILSDAELLQLYITTGNQDYLAELYERYRGLVIGIGLRTHLTTQGAEDMYQNLYIKLVNSVLKAYKKKKIENFKAYLWAAATNKSFDESKMKKKFEKIEEFEEFSSDNRLEIMLEDENLYKKLEKCINILPADQKICIELFYSINKKNYEEISELTGFSQGKVDNCLYRARISLRECANKLNM